MLRKTHAGFALLSVLALAGCSGGADVREELGLKKAPPDEFAVVTRAPLSVPPDYTLRPPRPGAERPMELSVREQARKTVFGVSDVAPKAQQPANTGASGAFLNKLGANNTDPSIRESLNAEMRELDKAQQPAAEKLLFWKEKEPRGKTIDPVEEQKRLDAQKAQSGTAVQKRNEDILETP